MEQGFFRLKILHESLNFKFVVSTVFFYRWTKRKTDVLLNYKRYTKKYLISASKTLCQVACFYDESCYAYHFNKINLKCEFVEFEVFEDKTNYDCYLYFNSECFF